MSPPMAEPTDIRLPEEVPLSGLTSSSPAFRILTFEELGSLPEPEWLIETILPVGSLAVLYGHPGAGKSFLALDMALAIACGVTWHGRSVKPGRVLYTAAGEGETGLGRRVNAWYRNRRVNAPPNACFMTTPVQLHEQRTVDAFCRHIERQPSSGLDLAVFDTLARCTVGADENSSRDMGLAIAGVDRIRSRTGAAVLLCHHAQKTGGRERGSSALFGAADTVWHLRNHGRSRVLEPKKQKDAEPFKAVPFVLRAAYESCVVEYPPVPATTSGHLTPNQLRCLEALHSIDAGNGAAASTWFEASGLTKPTFYRMAALLAEAELVEHTRGYYRLLDAGYTLLSQVSTSLKDVSRDNHQECLSGLMALVGPERD